MRALRYAVDEAMISLWRGRRSAVLSLATIAVAMFVLGGFLLLTSNAERLVQQWSTAAEFSVYLDDEATSEQRAAIENMTKDSGLVARLEYVSKSEAARRFAREFPDLAGSADLLARNPLPASIEVRLRPDVRATDQVRQLADRLRPLEGIADVRYDHRWIERVLSAVRAVRSVGLILAAVLVMGAALTVASVIRLALHARRDEVHIMQLVGAPMVYIRGPFILEGVLQGGAGALVAMGLLWTVYLVGRAQYSGALTTLVDVHGLMFLPLSLSLLLLAGGMTVGCLGGLVATRSAR